MGTRPPGLPTHLAWVFSVIFHLTGLLHDIGTHKLRIFSFLSNTQLLAYGYWSGVKILFFCVLRRTSPLGVWVLGTSNLSLAIFLRNLKFGF